MMLDVRDRPLNLQGGGGGGAGQGSYGFLFVQNFFFGHHESLNIIFFCRA